MGHFSVEISRLPGQLSVEINRLWRKRSDHRYPAWPANFPNFAVSLRMARHRGEHALFRGELAPMGDCGRADESSIQL
jgi:hypothetical protein